VALAVTLPANNQSVAVMGEPVESGTGQEIVTENFGPFLKGAITGDN